MYPKTRDLEIVYNLVWKSEAQHSDDRANIVGMYDIPSTTLNWDIFKSYLLKNSGSSANDIKVSYIDGDEKEVPINNQNDFQLALYSFRRRARIAEIITLKLDKITPRIKMPAGVASRSTQSTDVEIQTPEYKDEATQPIAMFDADTPPKWFAKHMKKFEKKMMEEIKQQFTLFNSKIQAPTVCQHAHPTRSKPNKPETYKRPRKFEFPKANMDKELCKQYKFEKKLESKLEKLEHKTCKIKAKKLAAIKVSSDSDVGLGSAQKFYRPFANEFFTEMTPPNNVVLNSSSDKTAGPLYTNSVYLQRWEVINTGQSPWDDRTELRYAWGSEKLRPTFTILKCPELQPGEKGEISVWFQIPSTPGTYECFWHFYDCGRRFGHWIGCHLTVIDYPRKVDPPSIAIETLLPTTTAAIVPQTVDSLLQMPATSDSVTPIAPSPSGLDAEGSINRAMEELSFESPAVVSNNLNYTSNFEPGSSSDSDNISILYDSNSNSASSDYEIVHSPDSTTMVPGEDAPAPNDLNADNEGVAPTEGAVADAISVASEAHAEEREVKVAENESSEYAYIYYNGEKYPFHKEYLRPEYFLDAEKCEPADSVCSETSSASKVPARYQRETSTSSQESAKRLFVFPRHSPGYEVVYPAEEVPPPRSASSFEGEEYYSLKDGFHFAPQSESHFYQARDEPTEHQGVELYSQPQFNHPLEASTEVAETQTVTSTNEGEQPKFNGRVRRPTPPSAGGKRENILTEAAILASSAMSSARNVVNMVINTGNGKWVNGHWVADSEYTKRENGLKLLAEMGFMDRDLNATLLARYNDDVHRVISELIQ